jgi:hypothetical protein
MSPPRPVRQAGLRQSTQPAGATPSMVDKHLQPYLDDLRKAGVPQG